MVRRGTLTLLVGDNPFHGVSHLSQERSRLRGSAANSVDYAAEIVMTSVKNGADGFMFSASEKTLSILKKIQELGEIDRLRLYPLVPYAYDYVRLATQLGGITGLSKSIAKQVITSRNFKSIGIGLKGLARADPVELMKAYLTYEISRVRSSAGKHSKLEVVFLHEVITDMAIALNLDDIFRSYVDFVLKLGIRPGFETRNFAYLVNKFREWDMNLGQIVIATPFNKIGFQMNPSQRECENTLASLSEANVIAMSILAAGYLGLDESIDYARGLPNLMGIVVGVSKPEQAINTFNALKRQ